jgi:hypothetical protein
MSISIVLQELENLSVEEIANLFEDLGIKGTKDDPCLCPLARYLEMKLDDNHISVGNYSVSSFLPMAVEQFIMPLTVREFVHRFDNGEFPELEDES